MWKLTVKHDYRIVYAYYQRYNAVYLFSSHLKARMADKIHANLSDAQWAALANKSRVLKERLGVVKYQNWRAGYAND